MPRAWCLSPPFRHNVSAPLGIPAWICASFWDGVWGVLMLSLAPSFAEGPGMPGLRFGFGATQDLDPDLDTLPELLRQH